MKATNFLISGVGGQGTLLVSNVLSEVGVEVGWDVKKSEVHGMAQRGGSVTSHVRWGEKVWSPVIGQGDVDVLLALEKLEGLRYLNMLKPNALVLVGDFAIPPLSVSSGDDLYPTDDEILNTINQFTQNFWSIPTITIAERLGNSRVHNIVLLGALSVFVDGVSQEVWKKVIAARVPPKHLELNLLAFDEGLLSIKNLTPV
jgi:indolepyruvate ferredoxin oxidoreductase, beta subunit